MNNYSKIGLIGIIIAISTVFYGCGQTLSGGDVATDKQQEENTEETNNEVDCPQGVIAVSIFGENIQCIYSGILKNNLPEYHGVLDFEHNGHQYEYNGEFHDGLFDGLGKFQNLTTGDCYYGKFKEGFFNGAGTKSYGNSNCYYDGNFENGFEQGYGTIFFEYSQPYEGEFKRGVPVNEDLFKSCCVQLGSIEGRMPFSKISESSGLEQAIQINSEVMNKANSNLTSSGEIYLTKPFISPEGLCFQLDLSEVQNIDISTIVPYDCKAYTFYGVYIGNYEYNNTAEVLPVLKVYYIYQE